MQRTKLLSTAAIVLMLGTGAALAQAPAPSKDQAPAQPAPAAQQNAPAEKVAPSAPVRPAPQAQTPKAADPAQAPKAAPSAAAETGKGDMKVPPAAAGKAEVKGAAETNKAAETGKPADANRQAAPAGAERSTTGQGAGGSARLSAEQRSKITTVIRSQKVQPAKLDIAIRVGTRVPSTVRYYPLPTEVITYYPEWRGYDYILVGDQILVLNPRTHEIVAILQA